VFLKPLQFSSERSFLILTVLLGLLLYLPTLRTGFLTDDFLDCGHRLSEVPNAFLNEAGGGYRPLMILSWSVDNALWDVTGAWGWHLTNLVILVAAVLSLMLFLRCFIGSRLAVNAAAAFFVFSGPVAVAVARVSWRTTILALIPLLLAIVLYHKWSRRPDRIQHIVFGSFLFLVSLLIKETGLTAFPVLTIAALCSSSGPCRKRNTVTALLSSLAVMTVYGLLRYNAMGLMVNYGESTQFGFFMVKNLLVQNAAAWSPWLSGIPARILLPVYAAAVYFVADKWQTRILLLSMGIFLVLPVSNLPTRRDLAVAAMPGAALFAAYFVQRLQGNRVTLPIILVFLAGVFSSSHDQVKLIRDASRSVEVQTARISEIAEALPGSGPVFFSGVTESVGEFGTFWPGDYLTPMICSGIQQERYTGGTERLWEILLETHDTGYLVFFEEYPNYPEREVCLSMYGDLPDTTVIIHGVLSCSSLVDYSCCISSTGGDLGIYLPGVSDSITLLTPDVLDGSYFYDLASSPLWLSRDSSLILVHDGFELLFSSRNIALEMAQYRTESKRAASI